MARNADTRLGGSISGAKASEDDGRCAAHRSEEGLLKEMIVSHDERGGYRGDSS